MTEGFTYALAGDIVANAPLVVPVVPPAKPASEMSFLQLK